jgi:hypothetical protein
MMQLKAIGKLWYLTCALAIALNLLIWRNFTVDDSFIAWRMGKNLATNFQYSYNLDQKHVEAATSLIYGIASFIPTVLQMNVLLFFKLLSILLILTFIFLSKNLIGPPQKFTFLILSLGGPLQALHIWSGLETGMVILISLLIFLGSLRVLFVKEASFRFVIIAGLLLRPEIVVTALFAIFVRYKLFGDQTKEKVSTPLIKSLITVGMTCFLLALSRLLYFGLPLPNTFFTKSLGSSGSPLQLLENVLNNVNSFIPFILASTISILAVDRKYLKAISLLFAGQLLIAVPLITSNLAMNYGARFPYQTFWPIVLVASYVGFQKFSFRFLIPSTLVLTSLVTSTELTGLITDYPRMHAAHGALGSTLGSVDDTGDLKPTLIIGDAGIAAYNSDWAVMDFLFLGSSAKDGLEPIVSKIESSQKTVVVLYSRGSSATPGGEQPPELLETIERSNYLKPIPFCWTSNVCLQVYLSSDFQSDPILLRRLNIGSLKSIEMVNSENQIRNAILKNYWRD